MHSTSHRNSRPPFPSLHICAVLLENPSFQLQVAYLSARRCYHAVLVGTVKQNTTAEHMNMALSGQEDAGGIEGRLLVIVKGYHN